MAKFRKNIMSDKIAETENKSLAEKIAEHSASDITIAKGETIVQKPPAKWSAGSPAPQAAAPAQTATVKSNAALAVVGGTAATAPAPVPATTTAAATAGTAAPTAAPATAKPINYFAVTDGLRDRPDVPAEKIPSMLVHILRTKRAHGSLGDSNFRLWLFHLIKSWNVAVEVIEEGCILATIPIEKKDGKVESKTLFSSHVDTCHTMTESDITTSQHINYDANFGHIFLAKEYEVQDATGKTTTMQQNAGCLGADDGVGVWIMLEMLKANVPGSYLFHTGEERGGIGSYAVAAKRADWLKKFDRAVAFDRPRDNEVIISQGGTKCASETAGIYLIEQLEKHGLYYHLSDRGTFTDTKVYSPFIPECFNLGVGYESQHSSAETLDVVHAMALCEAAITINWEGMPVARTPSGVALSNHRTGGTRSYGSYGGYESSMAGRYGTTTGTTGTTGKKKKGTSQKGQGAASTVNQTKSLFNGKASGSDLYDFSEIMAEVPTWRFADYENYVYESPEEAAKTLVHMFMRIQELQAKVEVLEVVAELS